MTKGAADRCWNNNGETGTKSGMNHDLRSEARGFKGPQEKGHENDATANTKEPGQETCQATQNNEEDDGRNTEGAHKLTENKTGQPQSD